MAVTRGSNDCRSVVRELEGRWSLTAGEPFQPGGQTAWVAPVRAADGAEFVLKLGVAPRRSGPRS